MSHKSTGKGPSYGEFTFPKSETTWVKGYARGGKVSQPKVSKVMHEFGAGELHSGSKSGPVVKSRKQAVAIAMSEGRQAAKHARGGVIRREAGGPVPVPRKERFAEEPDQKPANVPVVTSPLKRMLDKVAPIEKKPMAYKSGGMTARIKAMTEPTMSGGVHKNMNPSARMAPRFGDGGKVHMDAKQDQAMIKKAVHKHEKVLHPGKPLTPLKKGGMTKK